MNVLTKSMVLMLLAGSSISLMAQSGAGPQRGNNRPVFSDFDLDKNGVIVEEEFIQARNQRISERASQGYAMRGLSNARPFSEIDLDGDGKLTETEFAAAQASHRR